MKRIALIVAIVSLPFQVLAEGFDNQLRILLHGQKVVTEHFGVAGWEIVTDATNPKPRALSLAGFLWKDESRWAELMGGVFLDANGEEPLLDFRYSEKGFTKPFEGWLEIGFSPGPNKLLLSPSLVWPTPLLLFEVPIKVGGEADIFLIKGDLSRGVGPRIVFPLPVKGWTVAVAYQITGEGPDILRTYIGLHF